MKNGRSDKRLQNTSKQGKFISLILRHKPEVNSISLDEHSWAAVQGMADEGSTGGVFE